MAHDDRFVTVHNATLTEDVTSETKMLGARFTAWKVLLNVGTVTGTTPTINCYIQDAMRMADGTYTWTDYMSLTQLTAAGEVWARAVGSGEEMHAASDAALAAGQIRNGPVPSYIRAKFVVGGTNPSFPVELTIEAIP